MKFLFVLSLYSVCFFNSITFAQNLVPNPSFEDTVSCPFGNYQIDQVVSWTSGGGTPDYFNSCAASGGASVPNNFYGYQSAFAGNAYIGLYTYNRDVPYPGNREFVKANLTSPLSIGTKYYVSFNVSFTLDNNEIGFASNKLGVFFTNENSYSSNNPPISNNNAQVYLDTIVSDTLNWFHFSGSFISDSVYHTILIGNIFNDSLTDIIGFDTSLYISYYYIDDVCVSQDSNFCLQFAGLNENIEKTIFSISPNPSNMKKIWVEFNQSASDGNLLYQICSVTGTSLLEGIIEQNQLKTEIDLNEFNTGVYFIHVTINNTITTRKLIIN